MSERILRRELGQHLTGMDNICLQLEHPQRRMTIGSLWTFDQRLDTTLVMAALENLCTRYPRFCLIPQHDSPWETSVWSRPHQHWKFRDNFYFHTLTSPTLACLHHYVTSQYVKPFDRNKPLWEAHLISGLENKQCAFLWKVHHCMSDSIGLLKALFAATTSMDPKEEMYRQWQQQQQQQAMQRQRHGYGGRKSNNSNRTFDRRSYHHQCLARQRYQQLQYENAKRKFGMFWQQMMVWLLWGWSLMGMLMQQASYELATLRLLATPWFYQCKKLVSFLHPLRFLSFHHQQRQSSQMHAGSDNDDQILGKQMAWTDNLGNGDFQKVQRLVDGWTDGHGSLDDVVLLVLGRAMQRYTQQHKQPADDGSENTTYRVLYPVTFRHPMDWTLKNATLGSMLALNMENGHRHLSSPPSPPPPPTTTTTTVKSVNAIHQHRIASQRSLLPSVVHTLLVECLLRYFPFLMVPHWIQQWYADLPHATMTSIAGSTTSVFFGGQVMNECYVLPSHGGKGSISVGVLSYGDKINLSILTDDDPACPDLATSLCNLFVAEFNAVVDEALVMADGYGSGGIIM